MQQIKYSVSVRTAIIIQAVISNKNAHGRNQFFLDRTNTIKSFQLALLGFAGLTKASVTAIREGLGHKLIKHCSCTNMKFKGLLKTLLPLWEFFY